MTSKLADIEAALDRYNCGNKRIEYDAQQEINNYAAGWLTDLLAVVKAAQAMRAEIRNIPQTVMTYHMYDVVADYDKALTKLESEAQP